MTRNTTNFITVETTINATIEQVWKYWTTPADLMLWNNISEEWKNVKVESDLRPGGRFLFVMAKKDGSQQFDHGGTYDDVQTNALISYTLDDGRKTIIHFTAGKPVKLVETFQPTQSESTDMQRDFTQAILDAFKNYVEAKTL